MKETSKNQLSSGYTGDHKNISLPPACPRLTIDTINAINEGIDQYISRWHSDCGEKPFICTYAIYWQSEDRHIIHQIARYDKLYINGKLTGSCALPPEFELERLEISHLFEPHVVSNMAWGIGIEGDISRLVNNLYPALNKYNDAFDYLVLWEGYGALLFPILTNEIQDHSGICDGIESAQHHLSFSDCRCNDNYWNKRNDYYWSMAPEKK